jgi:hypothetical protein
MSLAPRLNVAYTGTHTARALSASITRAGIW